MDEKVAFQNISALKNMAISNSENLSIWTQLHTNPSPFMKPVLLFCGGSLLCLLEEVSLGHWPGDIMYPCETNEWPEKRSLSRKLHSFTTPLPSHLLLYEAFTLGRPEVTSVHCCCNKPRITLRREVAKNMYDICDMELTDLISSKNTELDSRDWNTDIFLFVRTQPSPSSLVNVDMNYPVWDLPANKNFHTLY